MLINTWEMLIKTEDVNKHRRCTAGFYIAVIQINKPKYI